MSSAASPKLEPGLIREFHRIEYWRHYARLGSFVVLYLLSATGAWWLHVTWASHVWVWLAAVPCYVFAAAALHGVSLFTVVEPGVGIVRRGSGHDAAEWSAAPARELWLHPLVLPCYVLDGARFACSNR